MCSVDCNCETWIGYEPSYIQGICPGAILSEPTAYDNRIYSKNSGFWCFWLPVFMVLVDFHKDPWRLYHNLYTSSSRASRWRKFQKKKELYRKERICLQNVRKMTDHCDVQTFFWVWTKLLPLQGCDVMRFGVMCLWFDLLSSDVASCEVICGTTPVLLCTTKNYSSTTLYYKVLLQYYSVLQSTTPVLLCTTQ